MALKNYYTAREAQERLGIHEGNFFYLVKTGRIKKVIPPGKKQGVYPKAEIDALAIEMLAFMTYNEKQGIQFLKAKAEDIQEEFALATMMFGTATHDIATREAWLKKNPGTDFILRDNGKLVAFINVLPVKHETITNFMNGKIRGWEISADDIFPYEPNNEYECIIMGMAVTPEVGLNKRTHYGSKIISGFMRYLEELAEKNIIITKFYATSVTPSGISILRNAGFKEISHIGKRLTFELDTLTSDAWLAREYRKILKAVEKHEASRFKIDQRVV